MILEDSLIIPSGLCGPLACMVALLRYIGKSFSLAAWIATKLGSILAFEFLFWVSYGVFWHRIRCNSKGESHHGMCSWLTNNNSNSKGNYTNRFWPLDHLFFFKYLFDLLATPQIVTDDAPKAPSRGPVATTRDYGFINGVIHVWTDRIYINGHLI